MNLPKISQTVYARVLIVLLVVLAFASARAAWTIQALELQPKIEVVMAGGHVSRAGIYEYMRLLKRGHLLSKLSPYVLAASPVTAQDGATLFDEEIAILQAEIKFHDIGQAGQAAYEQGGLDAAEPFKAPYLQAKQDLQEAQQKFLSDAQLIEAPADLRAPLAELIRQ